MRCDFVFVISEADRQRVADENPTRWRLPRGGQNVRARLVNTSRRVANLEGREPKDSGLSVEQAAEYARRVEAGHTKPADPPIGSNERAGVAVG